MIMKPHEDHWVHTAGGEPSKWIREHATYASDDCLPWPFFRDSGVGRGRITVRHIGAFWSHRVMCEYVNGPPPTPKHQAAHECGNGHLACMNPLHLRWKTASENALDRAKHGTNRKRARRRKLTIEQVEQIKALKGIRTQMDLAAEYGVSDNAIRNIHAGRTWRDDARRERVFTVAEVLEIRKLADYIRHEDIGGMFSVHRSVIDRIVNGTTYADVVAVAA